MLTAVQPPVRIAEGGCVPAGQRGRWRAEWLVANISGEPLRLEDAWVPHGRFRGEGHVSLDLRIDTGESATLELVVAADEPPGALVQNAFLILQVRGEARAWRVFARMRVAFNDVPAPQVEVVTAQSI